MKTGIMGGTFNPIHNAHLEMAKAALQEFHLDRILFIPDANPYHKSGETAETDKRVEMVAAAIKGLKQCELSLIDVQRGGNTYSVDTLSELHVLYPEDRFWFLIGGDSLETLHTWNDAKKLCQLTDFLIFQRDGTHVHGAAVERLQKEFGCRLWYASTKVQPISSTDIRQRIKARESTEGLLPKQVRRIIDQYGLYQE